MTGSLHRKIEKSKRLKKKIYQLTSDDYIITFKSFCLCWKLVTSYILCRLSVSISLNILLQELVGWVFCLFPFIPWSINWIGHLPRYLCLLTFLWQRSFLYVAFLPTYCVCKNLHSFLISYRGYSLRNTELFENWYVNYILHLRYT